MLSIHSCSSMSARMACSIDGSAKYTTLILTTAMNPAKYMPNLAIRTRPSLAATGAWTLRRMSGSRAIYGAFAAELLSS